MADHGSGAWTNSGTELRHELLVAQLRVTGQAVDLEQPCQVEHSGDADDVGGVQVEGRGQELLDLDGGVVLDLQTHGGAAAALADLLLDGLEQVFDFVVVDFDVAVARQAEGGVLAQEHARKEVRQVHSDDGFERRENMTRRRSRFGRQRHEPRQHGRRLDDGEQLFLVAGPAQHHREVERLVEEVREGVAGVDGQRRQHRENLALEDQAQVPFIGVGEVLEAAEDDALALQRRQHAFVEAAVGLGGHAPDGLFDAFELLLDRHVVGAGAVGDAGLHLLLQAADADHEKLIQVRLENGEEFEALQQRYARVLRLLQDAAVKFEPAQLAVDVQRRVRQAGAGGADTESMTLTSPRE